METRLKKELKDIAELEAKLAVKRSTVRALTKAVESLKRKEVKAMVKKAPKPKAMKAKIKLPNKTCRACLYRALGKPGGSGHTYKRGECKYRSKGVVW